jgi:chloramphenicol-sensitive protein RarD
MNRGYAYAIGAYAIWGLLPIYWQTMKSVPPTQVVAHRILWSCLVLFPVLFWSRQWSDARSAVVNPSRLGYQALGAVLVCLNWLIFIVAVNTNHILECSLGYFITPLFNVVLAVAILREKTRPALWVSVGLVAVGVAWLAWHYGQIPWFALLLAATFGLYGLVKKTTQLPAVASLSLETWVLGLPALCFLVYQHQLGNGSFGNHGRATDHMLLLTGVATTVPLLLFGAAAQKIPFTAIGMLQYIGPTLQLIIGVALNNEPFDGPRRVGFGLVWMALAIYAMDRWWEKR